MTPFVTLFAGLVFVLLGAGQSAVVAPRAPIDSLTVPGISRALAAYRSERIADVRYRLRLDVTGRDTAIGRADIRFVRRGTGDLVLDYRGPFFANMAVNGQRLRQRSTNGHLVIPESLLRDRKSVV